VAGYTDDNKGDSILYSEWVRFLRTELASASRQESHCDWHTSCYLSIVHYGNRTLDLCY
jgi:hypothetical protein